MKTILPLVFLFAFANLCNGQTASKNEEYCRTVLTKKKVEILVATFEITPLGSSNQNDLTDLMYQLSQSIYKVKFGENLIEIYYIDDVNVDFLKELLVQQNCYVDLISIVNQPSM